MSNLSNSAVETGQDRATVLCRDGSQPRVLFAEDASAARILTSVLLKKIGCNVDAVEHGEEALMLMQNFNYDLVLMDVEMPVMDGVTAAREIRSLGGLAGRTPIIALSAFIADCGVVPEWQSEFDAGLTKPAARHTLQAIIQKALDGELSPAALEAPSNDNAQASHLFDEEEFDKAAGRVSPVIWSELLATASEDIRGFAGSLRDAERTRHIEGLVTGLNKLEAAAGKFGATELIRSVEEARKLLKTAMQPGRKIDGPLSISTAAENLIACADRTSAALKERSRSVLQ